MLPIITTDNSPQPTTSDSNDEVSPGYKNNRTDKDAEVLEDDEDNHDDLELLTF